MHLIHSIVLSYVVGIIITFFFGLFLSLATGINLGFWYIAIIAGIAFLAYPTIRRILTKEW